MTENNSGIYPCGHKILVLPNEVEEKTSGGIVLPSDLTNKEEMAQTEGILIAVGQTAWYDQPGHTPWAKVGDKILFGKYTGKMNTGADGKKYRIINDLDIDAVLVKE